MVERDEVKPYPWRLKIEGLGLLQETFMTSLKEKLCKKIQKQEPKNFPSLFDFFQADFFSETSNVHPNWVDLPQEITALILSRLGAVEIINTAQKVCTKWLDICKDPFMNFMWQSIDMWKLGDLHIKLENDDLEKMCMLAIDRSCDGLVDISIEYFCTDRLLIYMAPRYFCSYCV